jgi:hypothetical protein
MSRERLLESAMIGACGLEHHPCHCQRRQPFAQRPKTLRTILEPLRRLRLQMKNVEVGFGNIDPDAMLCHLRQSFSCHAWLKHAYPFRPMVKTAVDLTQSLIQN